MEKINLSTSKVLTDFGMSPPALLIEEEATSTSKYPCHFNIYLMTRNVSFVLVTVLWMSAYSKSTTIDK